MAANILSEIAGIDLGDERRNRRIGRLASRMAASPQESIRAACKGWAEAIGGFRLLHNEEVTWEKILCAHEQATLERAGACERILLVQDTTELNYSSHKSLIGAGRLDAQTRQGFYAHNHLLVDEDTGVALGLCGSYVWTREQETKRHGHKQVPFEEKESHRWFQGYLKACEVAQKYPAAEVLTVGDRESDIYEIYAEWQRRGQCGENRAEVLVRAGRDRVLLDADNHLFQTMRDGQELGTYSVEFASKAQVRKINGNRCLTHRLGRKATLEVRSTKVRLKPTHRKHGGKLPPVELWAVCVLEIDPPQGHEPIEWFLLTSLPAETFSQARRVIRAYANRWLVEELHRILKSGCRVERINLRTSAALLPAVALYLIVAWRILYLRDFRRAPPDLCCSIFFTSAEWQAACLIQGRPVDTGPPTLEQMVGMVGKMGGHMGRKKDPSPGPECLWRGMEKLRCYVEMGQALGRL